MEKRVRDDGARRYDALSILVRLLTVHACTVVILIAGCGGKVGVPEEDMNENDPSQEGGLSGGSVSASLSAGKCASCEGQPECAFCLVHAYDNTYVCPPGKSAPEGGCTNLGEQHTSNGGQTFTCHYCN